MNTSRLILIGMGVAAALAGYPTELLAQPAASPGRADVTGLLAWHLVDTGSPGPYADSDWRSSLFGGGSAGWHWSEHHKSEVDFGVSTSVETYRVSQRVADGRTIFGSSRLSLSRRTLGLSQQYQFYENAWFHPHVAGGIDVTWERATERFDPETLFDNTTGRPVTVGPARTEGPRETVTVRPFVGAGFKAYMTPRTFFRTDLRIAVRDGIEESLLRMGFGFDF